MPLSEMTRRGTPRRDINNLSTRRDESVDRDDDHSGKKNASTLLMLHRRVENSPLLYKQVNAERRSAGSFPSLVDSVWFSYCDIVDILLLSFVPKLVDHLCRIAVASHLQLSHYGGYETFDGRSP